MSVNEWLRLSAGAVVVLSVVLGLVYSPYWFGLTIFVGLNLIRSAFARWCPMMTILRQLGVKE